MDKEKIKVEKITLGDGTIGISDMFIDENGYTGIEFTPIEKHSPGDRVSKRFKTDPIPKDVFFQILSNNPVSLDVLIRAAERAKQRLIKSNVLNCSFCGKSQKQVRKLIAAPSNICICDECIYLSVEIIEGTAVEIDKEENNGS